MPCHSNGKVSEGEKIHFSTIAKTDETEDYFMAKNISPTLYFGNNWHLNFKEKFNWKRMKHPYLENVKIDIVEDWSYFGLCLTGLGDVSKKSKTFDETAVVNKRRIKSTNCYCVLYVVNYHNIPSFIIIPIPTDPIPLLNYFYDNLGKRMWVKGRDFPRIGNIIENMATLYFRIIYSNFIAIVMFILWCCANPAMRRYNLEGIPSVSGIRADTGTHIPHFL